MPFLTTQFPRWLEFSGLPQKISQQIGLDGWILFKKLIELDYLANPQPDLFNESIARIAQMTGLEPGRVRETLESLRDLQYIECYLPETDSEPVYLKIRFPIQTPVKPSEIPFADGGLLGAIESFSLRYHHQPEPAKLENGSKFAQILHWYFDLCGMKMNNLILDELKELETNFELEKIKPAFQKAKQNNTRSLSYIFKQLYAPVKEKKQKNGKTKKRKNEF
ncbi:MAG: hypothetical protein QME64_06990 [bacterium]|nr:hypothetical protein [bacterium]